MTEKCRKVKVGMNRSEVDTILGFTRQSKRMPNGTEVEEWAFGGVERNGGIMRIVYAEDGRVSEAHLERWK